MTETEEFEFRHRLEQEQAAAQVPASSDGPSTGESPAFMHNLAVSGSGFNKGLAGTLGSPVDLVNAGLSTLGLPVADMPFMGSRFIQQYLLPEQTEPTTTGEKMAGRIAEEVGATTPFIGGTLALRAAKTAEQGVGVVSRMIKDLQAIDPGKLAAVETALASTGGLGAAIMNEIFPEGGWKADFVGELLGSVGPTAALGLIRKAYHGVKSIPDVIGFKSDDQLKQSLGEKLNTLGRSEEVQRGIDTSATLEHDIPGFKPTTGQSSGEPGLLQAERTFERSGGEATQQSAIRRKDNQTAIRSSVDAVAPEGGKLGDVTAGIERERERRTQLFEKGLARAQAQVEVQKNLLTGKTAQIVQRTEAQMEAADARARSRIISLEAKLTPQQQGAVIRQEYGEELTAYQEAAKAKYAKVDRSIPLPVNGSHDAAKAVRAELRTQEADEFVPSGALADIERMGIREEVVRQGPMAKATTTRTQIDVPLGELDALKKRLDGEIRAAPNDTVRRRLTILRDGVESDLDQLADNAAIKAAHPEASKDYADARSFAKKGIARLKSGEADALRQLDKTGRNKVGNDAVAQRFLDGEDSIDDFVNALGSRPAARMALEDAAKLDFYRAAVDPSTGMIHTKAADKWTANHQHILKEFPELGVSVFEARNAQAHADQIRKAGQATLKDPEAMAKLSDPASFDQLDRLEQHAAAVADTVKRSKADWERSAASLFLNDDADRAAMRIIGSATPQTKINQVIGQLGNDPVARRGFERAMWDAALSKFESKAIDALDRPILQARNGKEFLEENRAWMEPLFGKERVSRLGKALDAAEMVERGNRVVLPGGSDTAVNLQSSLSDLGPFLSRLYAHQHGAMSLKWFIGTRAAKAIGGALQKVTQEQASALLTQAFFDPQVAHSLMLAAKGGNERLIQQRFRLHLANLNQLSPGQESESEQ